MGFDSQKSKQLVSRGSVVVKVCSTTAEKGMNSQASVDVVLEELHCRMIAGGDVNQGEVVRSECAAATQRFLR